MAPPWEVNEAAKAAVGYAATVAAVLLFLSPARTFWRICQRRSVGSYTPLPYSMALNNCFTWTVYGLPNVTPGRTAVWVCNGIGVVLEVVYLAIFTAFAPHRLGMAVAHLLPCAVYCTLVASLTFAHVIPEDRTTMVLGILGGVWCLAMYTSPLAVMRNVIRTRSVEFMPLSLSLATLACSSLWLTYGVYVLDYYIIAPNAPGVLVALGQLLLYAKYAPRGKPLLQELTRLNTVAAGHQFPPAGPPVEEPVTSGKAALVDDEEVAARKTEAGQGVIGGWGGPEEAAKRKEEHVVAGGDTAQRQS